MGLALGVKDRVAAAQRGVGEPICVANWGNRSSLRPGAYPCHTTTSHREKITHNGRAAPDRQRRSAGDAGTRKSGPNPKGQDRLRAWGAKRLGAAVPKGCAENFLFWNV